MSVFFSCNGSGCCVCGEVAVAGARLSGNSRVDGNGGRHAVEVMVLKRLRFL